MCGMTYPLKTLLHNLPPHPVIPQINKSHIAERIVELPRNLLFCLVATVEESAKVYDGDGRRGIVGWSHVLLFELNRGMLA